MRRLGLSSEQVAAQPAIGPVIAQTGILPDRIIEVLRGDQEEGSQKVVEVWDSLTPAQRRIVGLEAIALLAGLTPRRLWEIYAGAALMQSRESVGVMIADALPKIMAVTIKDAQTRKGFLSREHIYKAARVLPTPKGSVTHINLGGAPEIAASRDEEDSEGMLESADEQLLRFNKAMQVNALPAPQIAEEPEIEEEEESHL